MPPSDRSPSGGHGRRPGQAPADYEVSLRSLSQWELVWRKFRQHRLALMGLGLLTVLVGAALIGPIFLPFTPVPPRPDHIVFTGRPPSLQHPFGETGGLQTDVLMLVVNGARTSLFLGFTSMAIGVIIGTIVGAVAGYVGGFVDNLLMRIVDVMLSLPLLFVILVVARFFKGASDNVWSIILVFGLFSWMGVSRLVRSLFLSIREREFVEAARAVGVSDSADHLQAHPAERPEPDRRRRIAARRREHQRRGVRELPRLRDQPVDADVGQRPLERAVLHRPGQLVVAALPGPGDHPHRPRRQLRR